MKKILCPVDLSEPSRHALRAAIKLALRDKASLTVLRVHELRPVVRLEDLGDDFQPVLEHSDRMAFRVWLEGQRKDAGDVEMHERFLVGDPASTIVEVATDEEFDLVVIGNKGHSAVERFLVGSVATKVLHHAPCDVLLVK